MKIRKFQVQANTQTLPKDWTGSGLFISLWMDAYSIMVSEAECFIVRTTVEAAKQIPADSVLQEEARLCSGQEIQHAIAHQAYEDLYLQKQYYFVAVAKTLNFINYKILEPLLPLRLRMHFVAGLEHLNAILAALAIQEQIMKNDNPATQLFSWHFFEEYEHKDVTFDLLMALNGTAFERSLVMLILIPMLLLDVSLVSFLFVVQNPKHWSFAFLKDIFKFYFSKNGFGQKLIRAGFLYLDKNYSPHDLPQVSFAESYR